MLYDPSDPPRGAPAGFAVPPLFAEYALGAAYDEMFVAEGEPPLHYQALYKRLLALPAAEL